MDDDRGRCRDGRHELEARYRSTPPVDGQGLIARLAAANAQVQDVLNSLSGTTTPYGATKPIGSWVRGHDR